MKNKSNCQCEQLKLEVQQLKEELQKINYHYEWLKRSLFGQKSERYVHNEQQLSLDLGIEQQEEREVDTKEITYTRTSRKQTKGKKRETMPTHLPFEDVFIEPKEDTTGLRKIKDEITWEYLYEPGSLKIRRYIRPLYALTENKGVLIAELPQRASDKGNFSPEIMAHITIDKYVYHMPLFRQIKKFRDEYNVTFAESTFCDIVQRTCFWIEPVYRLCKSELLASDYIQVDETTIPVLVRSKKGKTHKGYYWVYFDPLKKIVIFKYCRSRQKHHPMDFLQSFEGCVQVDGYAGYNALLDKKEVSWAACMDHVRRYFEKALKYDQANADYALTQMQRWYKYESVAREQEFTYEQRLQMRQEHIASSMNEFKEWCKQEVPNHRPKSPLRKALDYALNQWQGFNTYLSDGRVEISNIKIENLIRPVALGRKNYLFKGSEEAAQRGAIIYSLVATAQMHGLNAREYFKELLVKLPDEKANQVSNYLPYNI